MNWFSFIVFLVCLFTACGLFLAGRSRPKLEAQNQLMVNHYLKRVILSIVFLPFFLGGLPAAGLSLFAGWPRPGDRRWPPSPRACHRVPRNDMLPKTQAARRMAAGRRSVWTTLQVTP
jgi:hypothetical protein